MLRNAQAVLRKYLTKIYLAVTILIVIQDLMLTKR